MILYSLQTRISYDRRGFFGLLAPYWEGFAMQPNSACDEGKPVTSMKSPDKGRGSIHVQGAGKNMKKTEETRNPPQWNYAPKALLAIIVVVLVVMALDLLYAIFGTNAMNWRIAFLVDAAFLLIFGIIPLLPHRFLPSTLFGLARKWYLIALTIVITFFLFLFALATYVL
jgi:uncharacterized membrane protein